MPSETLALGRPAASRRLGLRRVARNRGSRARRLPAFLVRVHDALAGWQERRAERAALMALDARGLKDIGIGRGDAYREYAKPFWRD